MALGVLGNIAWATAESVVNAPLLPSLADTFYVTAYVLVFAGMLQSAAPVLQGRNHLQLLLNAAIISLAGYVFPVSISTGSATTFKGTTLLRALHGADELMYERKLAHELAKGDLASASKGK